MTPVIGRLDDNCLNHIVFELFIGNQTTSACGSLGLPATLGLLAAARLQSLVNWMDLHSRLFAGDANIIEPLSRLVHFNGPDVDTNLTTTSWLASDRLSPSAKFSLTAMRGNETDARSVWDGELDDETRRSVRFRSISSDDPGSLDVLSTCWSHHILNLHPIEASIRAAVAARICTHIGLDDAFVLWVRLLNDFDQPIVFPSLLFLCLEHRRFKMVDHLCTNYTIDMTSAFAHRFPDGVVDPKVAALFTSPELPAPIGFEILEQLFTWLPSIEREKLLWARHSHLLRRAVGRNQLSIVELLLSVATNLGMAGTIVAAKDYEALRLAKTKGLDDIYERLSQYASSVDSQSTIGDFFD